ncbi:succinate dehydrogenase [Yoonia sp.]|uniref:succinate dehydrogenase n=1 Tax=Yoonia sp. TaxID=2212373 RepID=UPI0025CF5390|nr:succinate dehydrogenase [Yoonia sp.]
MRMAMIMAVGVAALAGCADISAEGDRIARDTAKGVVNGVVASRFPGVNAAPLTDCIIDNAELSEVYTIAQAAVVGPTPATTNLIVNIAQRPATVGCATDNALSAFLLGG